MKIGDVARFDYSQAQDGPMRRLGKIIAIRDTVKNPVRNHSHRLGDSNFRRSRFLYTVRYPDGTIRSHYQHAMHPVPNDLASKVRYGLQGLIGVLRKMRK